jgi:hypothetical protein
VEYVITLKEHGRVTSTASVAIDVNNKNKGKPFTN